MKYLIITGVAASLALISPVYAGSAEYDDCILQNMPQSKLDVTTQLIKQACEENYQASSFTSEKRRAYNQCLLQHLAGVENLPAAMAIRAACDREHL